MSDAKTVTDTIGEHYRRQASPEVWAEIDALRERVAKLEAALTRALTDVGCTDEGLCPHWVEWHNEARRALSIPKDPTP